MSYLSDFYPEEAGWEIQGYNENSLSWDEFSLLYHPDLKTYCFDVDPRGRKKELLDAAWDAGILQSPEDTTVKDWLEEKKRKITAPLALACDTNLVLRGYIRNLVSSTQTSGYFSEMVLVLLTRTIMNEFHSMTFSKFAGGRWKRFRTEFTREMRDDSSLASVLLPGVGGRDYNSKLTSIHTERGRRGLKGQLEINNLYKELQNKVLLVKPSHMIRAPIPSAILDMEGINGGEQVRDALEEIILRISRQGLNDLMDSIIREEIDFFRTQTNAQVLFLTMDKQQDNSSDLEQLDHLLVKRPTVNWSAIPKGAINQRKLTSLLVSLLWKYPVLKIIKNQECRYFALSWLGRDPQNYTLMSYEDERKGQELMI